MVKHGKSEYVRGRSHTNTIEGFWSLLKRGIIGQYHWISSKHLDRYIKEFEFRYNTREMSCSDRFSLILGLSEKRLTYKHLIS